MSENRRRARLQDIAGIADALRDPVETPDFTSSILQRVHAEKPFVDPATRRWVPVVRLGAAGLAVMTIFAMTLIIFIKPELPEQLGAVPSVTTEFVTSAEDGLASGVAGLRSSVRKLSDAADTRRFIALTVAPSATAQPVATAEPAPVLLQSRTIAEPPSQPLQLAVTTVALPVPAPVAVTIPSAGTYAWREAGMAYGLPGHTRNIPGISLPEIHATLAADAPSRRTAHEPTGVSRYKTSLATYAAFTSSKPPALNPASPSLVKDLVNLITGQPAGDEQFIR
jgi:hypothetical protein